MAAGGGRRRGPSTAPEGEGALRPRLPREEPHGACRDRRRPRGVQPPDSPGLQVRLGGVLRGNLAQLRWAWAGVPGQGRDPRDRQVRGIRVAREQHAGRLPSPLLVGLRVPDHGHREPHVRGGREHVEPRTHRDNRAHPLGPREEVLQHYAAPCRLRARPCWPSGDRPSNLHPLCSHWQLDLPRHLRRRRSHVHEVRLPRRRAAVQDDGQVFRLQSGQAWAGWGAAQPEPLQGGARN
mmetsp:Transcript_76594/g.217084  ORF Transcript_76594/g.217084 Transcript_76594/m.217084 type:complete len:237 (-) Transcript_76594:361-1071(-)